LVEGAGTDGGAGGSLRGGLRPSGGSGAAGGAPTLDNAMKLYELWVNCAEESYAATVRKEIS